MGKRAAAPACDDLVAVGEDLSPNWGVQGASWGCAELGELASSSLGPSMPCSIPPTPELLGQPSPEQGWRGSVNYWGWRAQLIIGVGGA